MHPPKTLIRTYKDSDYKSCEMLVNNAWHFDTILKPQELANITKYLYTKGSDIASNFHRVAENNGKVIGFLFAFNEKANKPKHNLWFGFANLYKILCIKGMSFKQKKQFLGILNTHAKNRLKIVKHGRSEIVLFVIDPEYQKMGLGKTLINEFINQCKNSGVPSIIVETNKLGASRFYERIGFKLLSDFDSPLHEIATKGGQACIYEYTCQPKNITPNTGYQSQTPPLQ